ncbi:unnamed protein product [Clonostachys rosea f. rosea IK726]|uniref:Zn(2)-C6 fungal-type domain-containing protein n=2 Tax=Bionectria ochroleuca TaxID=29856 RepID=A0A0B7KIA5_BIOOC|nr:unnamed protein product [Clonostachys rosea f. rosea IK726]
MPSAPRSTACQTCKQKRTKCDKKWPACTQCTRKGVKCPGPSSLVKFVRNGHRSAPPSHSRALAEGSESSPSLQRRVMVSQGPLKSYRGGNGVEGSFRLQVPRSKLQTAVDTIGSLLISLLDTRGTSTFGTLHFLEFCPQRMSQSACLRDCVALYCHAWIQCHHYRQPVSEVLESKIYGVAIRSLRKTMNDDKLYTAETLGAMVLLERFMYPCRLSKPKEVVRHQLGIRHVMKQIGPPNPDDDLHSWLVRGSVNTMYHVAKYGFSEDSTEPEADTPSSEATGTSPYWGDGSHWDMKTEEDDHDYDDELATHDDDDDVEAIGDVKQQDMFINRGKALVLQIAFRHTKSWLPKISELRQNPCNAERQKAALTQNIEKLEMALGNVLNKAWKSCLASGSIIESLDPSFFLGRRVDFVSLKLAEDLLSMLLYHAMTVRMLGVLGDINGNADESLLSKYKTICHRCWLCFPYLCTVDAVFQASMFNKLMVTLEPATLEELGHFLALDMDWASCGVKDPKDVKSFFFWVHGMVTFFTGQSNCTTGY